MKRVVLALSVLSASLFTPSCTSETSSGAGLRPWHYFITIAVLEVDWHREIPRFLQSCWGKDVPDEGIASRALFKAPGTCLEAWNQCADFERLTGYLSREVDRMCSAFDELEIPDASRCPPRQKWDSFCVGARPDFGPVDVLRSRLIEDRAPRIRFLQEVERRGWRAISKQFSD